AELELTQHSSDLVGLVEAHDLSRHEHRRLYGHRVRLPGHYAAAWHLFLGGYLYLCEASERPREHEPEILTEPVDVESDDVQGRAERDEVGEQPHAAELVLRLG